MKVRTTILIYTVLMAAAALSMANYARADWTQHMCKVGGIVPEWGQTVRNWKGTAASVPESGLMITSVEIWPTDDERMADLFALSDEQYVELVKARAVEFYPFDNVALQFGNEITRPRSQDSFELATGLDFKTHSVAFYARRLALAVDAYRSVDPTKNLILGSLVTGGPEGRDYLLELLFHELPDGRLVHEIIDTVSVHYTPPPTFVTDLLPDKPVWNTEEIGYRVALDNRGYADALKELARNLIYWNDTKQKNGQLCLYASNTGSPNGDDAMKEVLAKFGNVRLWAREDGDSYVIYDAAGNEMLVD